MSTIETDEIFIYGLKPNNYLYLDKNYKISQKSVEMIEAYTKSESDDRYVAVVDNNVVLINYVLKTDLNSALTNYYDKSLIYNKDEVNIKFTDVNTNINNSLIPYAKSNDVDALINTKIINNNVNYYDKFNTYTKTEVATYVSNAIPAPQNLSAYAKTVDVVANYYNKTETYKKSEIDLILQNYDTENDTQVQTLFNSFGSNYTKLNDATQQLVIKNLGIGAVIPIITNTDIDLNEKPSDLEIFSANPTITLYTLDANSKQSIQFIKGNRPLASDDTIIDYALISESNSFKLSYFNSLNNYNDVFYTNYIDTEGMSFNINTKANFYNEVYIGGDLIINQRIKFKQIPSNRILSTDDNGYIIGGYTPLNLPINTETQNALNLKINLNDAYTKTETNVYLSQKMNITDTYTKTDVNNLLSVKANSNNTTLNGQTSIDNLNLKSTSIVLGNGTTPSNKNYCIAIGNNAGFQGKVDASPDLSSKTITKSISIGSESSANGLTSIAIGCGAITNVDKSIVLNATGLWVQPSQSNSTTITPIRNSSTDTTPLSYNTLKYNPSTFEVVQGGYEVDLNDILYASSEKCIGSIRLTFLKNVEICKLQLWYCYQEGAYFKRINLIADPNLTDFTVQGAYYTTNFENVRNSDFKTYGVISGPTTLGGFTTLDIKFKRRVYYSNIQSFIIYTRDFNYINNSRVNFFDNLVNFQDMSISIIDNYGITIDTPISNFYINSGTNAYHAIRIGFNTDLWENSYVQKFTTPYTIYDSHQYPLDPDTIYGSSNSESIQNNLYYSIDINRYTPNDTLEVIVYANPNFKGMSARFGIGSYTLGSGFPFELNDKISSIRIPLGYRATFYKDGGFTGNEFPIDNDTNDLISNGFEDTISSLRVVKLFDCNFKYLLENGSIYNIYAQLTFLKMKQNINVWDDYQTKHMFGMSATGTANNTANKSGGKSITENTVNTVNSNTETESELNVLLNKIATEAENADTTTISTIISTDNELEKELFNLLKETSLILDTEPHKIVDTEPLNIEEPPVEEEPPVRDCVVEPPVRDCVVEPPVRDCVVEPEYIEYVPTDESNINYLQQILKMI